MAVGGDSLQLQQPVHLWVSVAPGGFPDDTRGVPSHFRISSCSVVWLVCASVGHLPFAIVPGCWGPAWTCRLRVKS